MENSKTTISNDTLNNNVFVHQHVKSIKVERLMFEAWYPELPDLLMGTVDGVEVFNATKFLELRKSNKAVEPFFQQCEEIINYYSTKLGTKDLIFITQDNEYLMHAYLAFAFVSYVDPKFTVYMHDRMHELFSNGFLVSDNYLARSAKERLPKAVLSKLIEK